MHTLHLYVADLFPPADFVAQALKGRRVGGLAALLARGQALPTQDTNGGLGRLLGLAPGQGPAPYLLSAEGLDPGDDYWMRLDPVHLQFHRDHLYLADSATLELEAADTQSLVATLNAHFSADGLHCLAPHPQRWYLRLPTAPDLHTHPLEDVFGRRIDTRLPKGRDAPRWHGYVNEIQMLFHDHPVNQARETAGKAAVNSVWPWGGGHWQPLGTLAWNRVYSSMPLARALAQTAGIPIRDIPARLTALPEGEQPTLVAFDRLSNAARYGDARAWAEGLLDLDEDWFRPSLTALRRGKIQWLVLEGSGDTWRGVELDAWRAWRFWRRK